MAVAIVGYIIAGLDLWAIKNTIPQSIAILMMLAVIPISLKFSKKKFDEILSNTQYPEKWKIQQLAKLYILKAVTDLLVMTILATVYAITKDTSILYCELIVGIVLIFFCKPDKLEINEEVEQ